MRKWKKEAKFEIQMRAVYAKDERGDRALKSEHAMRVSACVRRIFLSFNQTQCVD